MVRRSSDGLIFVVAGQASYPNVPFLLDHNLIYSYSFNTNTWTSHQNLTIGKFGPGVVMTDDETKIIVAGGQIFDGVAYTNDFTAEMYNIGTDSWTPIAPLPNTALKYSFVKVNDNMLALTDVANTVIQYDMGGDAWNLVADVVTDAVSFDTIIAYVGDDYHQCG